MILKSSELALNDNSAGVPPTYEVIPHPDSLRSSMWSGKAYVVTVGLRVGIFKHWTEVNTYTIGVSSNNYARYDTWDEAFEVYKQQYEQQSIRTMDSGVSGWPADTSQNISLANSQPTLSLVPMPCRPEDLRRPAHGSRSNSYYAVTVGRSTGIFDKWDDAKEQTSGVAGNPPKFKIWDDAYNYYRAEYEQGRVQVKLRR